MSQTVAAQPPNEHDGWNTQFHQGHLFDANPTPLSAFRSDKPLTTKARIRGRIESAPQTINSSATKSTIAESAPKKKALAKSENDDSKLTGSKPDQENEVPLGSFSIRDRSRSSLVPDALAKTNGLMFDSSPQSPPTQNPAKKTILKKESFGKQAGDVYDAFAPLASKLEQSVTQIIDRKGRSVLGTVVSSDGLIVSKSSLVGDAGRCIFSDGQKWPFRVVATDEQRDLCLIKVNRKRTQPVDLEFARLQQNEPVNTSPTASPGSIVVSIGHQRSIASWGIVTLPQHDFQIAQPEYSNSLDFGATLSPYPIRVDGANLKGTAPAIKVLRVYPRTIAERMGLLVGDYVRSFNGRRIHSRLQIDRAISGLRSGDLITATILRDAKVQRMSFKVSSVQKQTMHDRWGGGPYSDRRFGFGPTLVHDSVLHPNHCGGPLVNLKGALLGINIARSMRVASLAIGRDDVLEFVRAYRPKEKPIGSRVNLDSVSTDDNDLNVVRTSTPSK